MDPRALLRPLRIPASGMAAYRARMDVIAQNIANVETTRTPEGGPYRRQTLELRPIEGAPRVDYGFHMDEAELSVSELGHFPFGAPPPPEGRWPGGVQIEGRAVDPSEGARIYDPGHPDADELGYVEMPNVDLTTEMVDLMLSRRHFEANATVFEAMKSVLRRAIDL